MKKLFITLIICLIFEDVAFAEGVGIEVFGGFASEPRSDFDATFGGGVGVNIDFLKIIKVSSKAEKIVKNIKFRADLSRYRWQGDRDGFEIEYIRNPLFIGGRYYYGANPAVFLFGEAGVEISYDEREFVVCNGVCSVDDETKTRSGPAIGAGVRFGFTKSVYGSFFLRSHALKDDYITASFGIGFDFK